MNFSLTFKIVLLFQNYSASSKYSFEKNYEEKIKKRERKKAKDVFKIQLFTRTKTVVPIFYKDNFFLCREKKKIISIWIPLYLLGIEAEKSIKGLGGFVGKKEEKRRNIEVEQVRIGKKGERVR